MSEILKERCDIILESLVGKNLMETWWQSQNKAFDMRTPQEQFDIDPEIVYSYLMGHALR